MKISDIEEFLAKEWAVISSAPIFFGAALIALIIIAAIGINYIYKQRMDLRDDMIRLLQQRLEISKEQQLASEKIYEHGGDQLDPELKSLIFGRPSVLELFLELTDRGTLKLRWNPLGGSPVWEAATPPTEKEIERMAAVQFLMDRGYISSITDNGLVDFTINTSDHASDLRAAYNKFID